MVLLNNILLGINSAVYEAYTMRGEFENIETYVLLDWLVGDFESKSVRYKFSGN